ncbi:PREDICTED: probable LRR receptor [Prunus dulcis]|uniref:non-specific serine/threonine protein kinase n=1 Tax=Prunus dulcis TaxID=3755 RepID=A0A5E4F955_PRUDU|nr:PREDICTED: probable LRR receptor [Prunus dulcis]
MSWTSKQLLFLLAGFTLNLTLLVHSQDDQSENWINYISDATFIDTGESKFTLPSHRDDYQQPYWSVRSFPEGARNCYKINVTRGNKYLIRASFLYGNYDGQDKIPEFELHLGPNLWDTVSLRTSEPNDKELIYVPLRNYIHVCLVNTGSGVPFISALELRPLPNASYQTKTGPLALVSRYDTGQRHNRTGYRYPGDVHDRFWYGYYDDNWKRVITSSTIDSDVHDSFQPPSVVMSTAATPKDGTDALYISWMDFDNSAEYFVYMHFAEFEKLQPNQSRQFNITMNGESLHEKVVPYYLSSSTIYSTRALSTGGKYNISIFKAKNSTLPPILNAIEVYTVKEFLESRTNQADVDAITSIKSTYKIKKNWQGDPCSPLVNSWEGINCSNEHSRIVSLNLSSSGLTGEIAPYISNLTMIHILDLSNNNLTGSIPEFLSRLRKLMVLNLEKNKLTGLVPVGLIQKRKDGLLSLRLCENPNLSGAVSCKRKKNSFVIPLVGSIVGISVLLLCIAAAWWGFKRKRHGDVAEAKDTIGTSLESTKRQFTYSEIIKITNNFKRILGKGGFGNVYHGYIEDTQLAIKMLSPSSVQGFQQFLAEVDLLVRVHHKNLTSLVGYCNDKTGVGLVYEYMSSGNLHAHLFSGSSSNILTWKDRLQIAIDAAQAKLSDFGLSRTFPSNDDTHISTVVAGTPGYLDPEYNLSNRLNEKSDVYSFGVVLLEIISCRPVYSSREHERIHISRWVSSMLAEGDIYGIVDPRFERHFNTNTVWKAVEIAMACVSPNAIKRPTMSQVEVELKESLPTEIAGTRQSHETELTNSIEIRSDSSISMLNPSVR